MEEGKLETLQKTMESIGKKKQRLERQTGQLRLFNTRLELFLKCLKAYSMEDTAEEESTAKKTKVEEKRVPEAVETSTIDSPATTREEKTETAELAIERLFKGNQARKSIAEDIHRIVKENEPIALDNLIKAAKHSKYKAIDVLNALIKGKMISKSYERGFVYRLNRK